MPPHIPNCPPAPRPSDDRKRVEALRSYNVLDTPYEPEFDSLTELAALACRVPMSMITLIDEERGWLKARHGIEATEGPRDLSFCAHAIMQNDLFEIPDTLEDSRFASHPAVTEGDKLRFYAATPLTTEEGFNIGVLAIADFVPRRLTEEEIRALTMFAAHVVQLLEHRRARARQLVAEEILRAREEQLSMLVNGSADVIYETDARGNFVFISAAMERMLGFKPEEMLGKHFSFVIQPKARAMVQAHYLDQRTRREPSSYLEMPCISKSGREVWVGQHVQVVMRDGEVVAFQSIARDITDLRAAQMARREIEERFLAFMNNSPTMSCIKDGNGRFLFVNDAMRRVFLQGRDIVGLSDVDLFPNGLPDEVRSSDQLVLTHGETIRLVETLPTPDGVNHHWLVQKFPMPSPDGTPYVGVVGVDVSDRVSLELDLADARDAAVASAKLKSEFLANMSHEIRTPMNGVLGMLGVLLDTNLNEDQRELAETARFSAESLLSIINDILDFSKIEAGKMTFEMLDFDVRETVESVLDLFSDAVRKKSLEIGCVIDADVPARVRGDAGRVRQVLLNLVGNAVKFTERGGVVVRVVRESFNDESVVVGFRVTDTGIGLSEPARTALFQPFVQADSSMSRRYGGTGLGLAISRHLTELMGGSIGVDSTLGTGSTFWFTARFAGPQHVQAPVVGRRMPRVLIVDDSATARKVMSMQMSAWKVPSETASDGLTAMAMLRDAARDGKPFDVVISDRQMAELDGIKLALLIKAQRVLGNVRVVIVSGSPATESAEQLRAHGITAWLTKPIKQQRLRDAIFGEEERRALPEPVSISASTASVDHGKRGRILVAEDNVVNQKVAVRLLAKLGYAADVAANGYEALEAIARMPYDLVLMDCHMPELDGLAATAELRRREVGGKRLPVIALTASALDEDRERCLEAGMDDFITKPVREVDLDAVLRKWMLAAHAA